MKGNTHDTPRSPCSPPVIVVSGGAGTSGMQVVNTVLAQFPGFDVPVLTVTHVREEGQVEDTVVRAARAGGIILHTMVDTGLRNTLMRLARERGVPAVDLMGDLIQWLQDALKSVPVCRPGLYRSLNRRAFERVEAIGFAIAHDDGQNLQDLQEAEIVLAGPSRVGKTPLAMYLAMQGWKTANIPVVSRRLPREIGGVEPGRIIGMVMDAQRLAVYRRMRGERLGLKGGDAYVALERVFDEVEQARELFRKKGYALIDLTDKPLESSADEVVRIIVRRFGAKLDESPERILTAGKSPMQDRKKARVPEGKVQGALESRMEHALKGLPYEKRKMFGCPAFFAQGTMFAGVYRNSAFIRLGEADRARLSGLSDDIRPFEPLPGRIMRQYLTVPDNRCEGVSFLQEWLKRSYDYALSLPPMSRKSPGSPRKRY